MKYLLLLVFLGILWWVWKKRTVEPPQPPARRPDPQPEKMVVCAHCGLLLPESDSLPGGENFYCCEAHRQAGSSGGQ
jgi:uncharacterized protein